MISYRKSPRGGFQAAYSHMVRIGYIDRSDEGRWLWTLNMLQPMGGRANGVATSEDAAKAAMDHALMEWVAAAGLQFALEKPQ